MSPNSRERDYERKRYEKWLARQAERQQQAQKARLRAGIAAGVTLVVVAGVGTALVMRSTGGDVTTEAGKATPSAASSASAAVSKKPNPCPVPSAGESVAPQKFSSVPDKALAEGKKWTWTINTSCGKIVATLEGDKAPQAVANAIFLSQKKFWDKTPCHRITLKDQTGIGVLQCGDPTGTGSGSPGYNFGPLENIPADGEYPVGTIAMARATSPDSQGSQFFIVHGASNWPAPGYSVFAHVTQGMDIVQKIVEGGTSSGGGDGAPDRPIRIESTSVTPA